MAEASLNLAVFSAAVVPLEVTEWLSGEPSSLRPSRREVVEKCQSDNNCHL